MTIRQPLQWKRTALIIAIGSCLFGKLVWFTAGFDTSPFPLNRASWTATLSVLIWILALVPWVRASCRVPLALLADAVVTAVALIDLLHWRYIGDVSSLSELGQAWQLWAVAPSVLSLLRPVDALLYVDVLAAAMWWWHTASAPAVQPSPISPRIWYSGIACALAIGTGLPALRLVQNDPDEVFKYSTTRREVVVSIGLIPYHLYDFAVQLAFPWTGRVLTSAAERSEALDLVIEVGKTPKSSTLEGVARGRNVVLVMCESLQRFPIGLAVNGQEVTPNLSAFARESLVFDNAYDQTYLGTTADGEFTSLNSLHPLASEVVSTRYGANDFFGLPAVLASHGYDTFSAVAERGDFWNKQQLHPKYGFHRSHFGDAFKPGEFFGLGLSDGDFFAQTASILATAHHPFMAFLITLSNHHPYVLPDHHKSLVLSGGLEHGRLGDYLESVHYFDSVFGQFVQRLRTEGVLDQSLVVVYGDHEGFWEEMPDLGALLEIPHGDLARMWKARKTLALMIRLPGAAHARVEESPAGQLDIAPTVLSLLGIDRVGEVILGRDLIAQGDPMVVLRDGSFVTRDRISIEAGPARGCYALSTLESRDCPPSTVRARARQRLRVSDNIIRGNLIPWLRARGRPQSEEQLDR